MKDVLLEAFLKQGEKKAITLVRKGKNETVLTYQEMNRDVNRMAGTLLARGVRKGGRILLSMEKCLFFMVAHLGSLKIGAGCKDSLFLSWIIGDSALCGKDKASPCLWYGILTPEVRQECGNFTFRSTEILKYCLPKHDDQWRYRELELPKYFIPLGTPANCQPLLLKDTLFCRLDQ